MFQVRQYSLPEEPFDFLGYTIGRCWSAETGRAYLGTRPSRQSQQRLCREISEQTDRRTLLLEPEEQAARLNRKLVGWANYFRLGPVSKAYRSVDCHAAGRLRQWLRRKHKLKGRGTTRYPDSYLYEKLGLVRLSERTRHLPWATA
jgi:RNA-directed DNA polymerase